MNYTGLPAYKNVSLWAVIVPETNPQPAQSPILPERFNTISEPCRNPIVHPELNSSTEPKFLSEKS